MTKEELKQEAEELIQRFEMANSMNCFMQLTPDRKQIGEMLVMIAEPREKRIEELEEDKQYFSDSLDKQIEATLKLQEDYKELEKENAELKTDYEVLSCSVGDFGELQEKFEEEQRKNNGLSDNLTKAKEIIKDFINYYLDNYNDYTTPRFERIKEAKQFLSEVEK